MLAGDDSPLPKRRALAKIQVPKDLEQQLVALFTTTAFRRYEEGMKREITYRDAARFWGLADTAHGDAVDQTLAKVPATLAAVEQLLIGDVDRAVERAERVAGGPEVAGGGAPVPDRAVRPQPAPAARAQGPVLTCS